MTGENVKDMDLSKFLSDVRKTDPIFEGIPKINFSPSKADPLVFENTWGVISNNVLHPFAPKDAAVITKSLADGNKLDNFMRSKVLNHYRDNSLSSMVTINQMKTGNKFKKKDDKRLTSISQNLAFSILKKGAQTKEQHAAIIDR